MGRELSIFADYDQRENRTTNYCGILFKLLYNDNPIAFENVINSFTEDLPIVVTPSFEQQSRKKSSIPDLTITQESFNLFFEVKTTDWFHADQILKHIDGLCISKKDVNILFLLTSEFRNDFLENEFRTVIIKAKEDGIQLCFITFEQLLQSFREFLPSSSISLLRTVDEFEDYLIRQNLLPIWKHRLDIVNCAGSRNMVENDGLYICPHKGGAYSHARSKYFGAYWDKNVNYLFEIDAVVIVEKTNTQNRLKFIIKWSNSEEDANTITQRAKCAFEKYIDSWFEELSKHSLQLFLLSSKKALDFRKTSKRGMQCSKRYYIVPDCDDFNSMWDKLNGTTWEKIFI